MPDGQTRQHLRTAVLELEQDYHHGVSLFVWFRVVRGYFILLGSGQGRSPRPGCVHL
jgi:hypothetical protein